MNWSLNEFQWLDWAVLAVGVLCIVWAGYRAIKKDKEKMKGADKTTSSEKVSLGMSLVLPSLLPTSVLSTS